MKPLEIWWQRFFRDEVGATAIEYAVMLSLIVVAVIASVGQLASSTRKSFDTSGKAVNSALAP